MSTRIFKSLLYYRIVYCVIYLAITHKGSDDTEKINVGDDFDTSIFNTVQKTKNFVTISYGFGMNDSWITEGKWLCSKRISHTTINENFCKNIRDNTYRFFWNNKCFSSVLGYNIVLSKHFVFLVFGKFLSYKTSFFGNDLNFLQLAAIYPKTDYLNSENSCLATMRGKCNEKEIKEKEQKIYSLKKQQKTYNDNINSYAPYNVSALLIKSLGIGVSIAWYSNMKNLSKSWFVKFPLLHISKQWISEICISNEAGKTYIPPTMLIRNNKVICMCGLEIGYAHFSIEIFINLTPILDHTLCFTETNSHKNIQNLQSFGFILKYNYC
ncbi:MAG: hypothetical protein II393_03900 [Cytophagales bacterium]|nr:hypothetical protein [Cytophagales bacterium]